MVKSKVDGSLPLHSKKKRMEGPEHTQNITKVLVSLLNFSCREAKEVEHFKLWTLSMGSCCVVVMTSMHVW